MTRRHHDDDATASGIPLRHAFRADPSAVAEPGIDTSLMTGCGRSVALGSGDARAPVDRPGAAEAQQHPSRRGDRLYYPDGRVTDLSGTPIVGASTHRTSLPQSIAQRDRWDRLSDRT